MGWSKKRPSLPTLRRRDLGQETKNLESCLSSGLPTLQIVNPDYFGRGYKAGAKGVKVYFNIISLLTTKL